MQKSHQNDIDNLVEHFFRNEYGKIVSVISRYLGFERIETAEDIVQETLLTAVDYWKHNGIPDNPGAWLYTTAKNKTLNFLRKQKFEKEFRNKQFEQEITKIEFSDQQISDDQLRVMLRCCQSSISEEVQITLILKILCGFSISEIASAFFTNKQTINKRLVRGRKKLKDDGFISDTSIDIHENLEVLLKTIYLLFNEGYFPSSKDQIVRQDLCLEAIRLASIIESGELIQEKNNVHALLALMYLNCARFKARLGEEGELIEMEHQDRSLWDQELINRGLYHLSAIDQNGFVSTYLLLASISANHCIARAYDNTNWQEILSLYDVMLTLENSPVIRLNRLVALSEVKGVSTGIHELKALTQLESNHLYYSTLAKFYKELKEYDKALETYQQAISICDNERDKNFLIKKMNEVVLISDSHV